MLGKTASLRQKGGEPAAWEPPAVVVYFWRELLLEEPETCPWEFTCKMVKSGYISGSLVWQTAEWADGIRENVRRLRLKQIVLDIQEMARQLV